MAIKYFEIEGLNTTTVPSQKTSSKGKSMHFLQEPENSQTRDRAMILNISGNQHDNNRGRSQYSNQNKYLPHGGNARTSTNMIEVICYACKTKGRFAVNCPYVVVNGVPINQIGHEPYSAQRMPMPYQSWQSSPFPNTSYRYGAPNNNQYLGQNSQNSRQNQDRVQNDARCIMPAHPSNRSHFQ